MIRAIMHGCNGKMGQTITGLCEQDPGIEIVAGIDAFHPETRTYPVYQTLAACDQEADVVIDFSNAAVRRKFHGWDRWQPHRLSSARER